MLRVFALCGCPRLDPHGSGDFMNPVYVRFAPSLRFLGLVLVVATAACGGDGGVSPDAPNAIERVSADSQTVAAGVKMSGPLVVLVKNGRGNPISGEAVEWAITNGGGTLSDSISGTDATGQAKTTYTPGTAPGIARITATVGGLPALLIVVNLVAGPPSALSPFGFANPAAVAGSILTLSAKAGDQFGNAITGRVVTWTASDGTISATTSTTDAGGVASVTYTLPSTPGTYTVKAETEGLPVLTFTLKAI